MTDDKTRQLENRIDKLESTIEKMMPSRRDALKMGGAALVGGAAMSGTASAGTNQVGTIGASPNDLVDIESEDINNADTVTTQDLVVNGTATGPFGGGGVFFEDGDSITQHRGDIKDLGSFSRETIFDLNNAVDVYGGVIFGGDPRELTVTFASNNTLNTGDFGATGKTQQGQDFGVISVFPMKQVKKMTFQNNSGVQETYGYRVFTT